MLLSQECAVTALAVSTEQGRCDGLQRVLGRVGDFWEARGKIKEGEMVAHGVVLKGHKLAVLCVATAGGLMFCGSADNTICVWRREGAVHTCMSVLTGHIGPVKCLTVEVDRASAAVGGDRKSMAYIGSLDKLVKVWSVSEETAWDMGTMRAAGMDENFNWESIPSAKY